MARFHMTAAGPVQFTAAEEAARDADEAAWLAAQPVRDGELARLAAVDAAITADAVLAQIKAMTTAEYDAWWAANVTTAAQAITVLKRVVRLLARRVPL